MFTRQAKKATHLDKRELCHRVLPLAEHHFGNRRHLPRARRRHELIQLDEQREGGLVEHGERRVVEVEAHMAPTQIGGLQYVSECGDIEESFIKQTLV